LETANQAPKLKGEKEWEEDHFSTVTNVRKWEEHGREWGSGNLAGMSHRQDDVDIHPTYVSVIVKSKVLRVVLPVEVLSDKGIARRIAASGYLELVMPKVRPNEDATGLVHVRDLVSRDRHAMEKVGSDYTGTAKNTSIKEIRCQQKRERLGESLMKAASVVDSLKFVRNQCSDPKSASSRCDDGDDDDGEDEPPPLM